MTGNMKQLKLFKSISLAYEEIRVFEDFSLEVPEGEITCIVGPSGCGKTSILNILAGLVEVTTGQVDKVDAIVGYIFQEDRLLPWETVYNNIRIVRDQEDSLAIMSILSALEIDEFAHSYPRQLSGGMRQRCSIARGFYYHASLLLMDEPFKSLDYDLRLNLCAYLVKLWEKNRNTIIFVTHDIDEALLLGHRIVVLSKRPTQVEQVFNIATAPSKRNILDEEHVNLRGKIIDLMTE